MESGTAGGAPVGESTVRKIGIVSVIDAHARSAEMFEIFGFGRREKVERVVGKPPLVEPSMELEQPIYQDTRWSFPQASQTSGMQNWWLRGNPSALAKSLRELRACLNKECLTQD
jgi:hypothetical protein